MSNPAGGVNIGNATGRIILDASGVRSAINDARNSLNGLQSVGGGIQSMGQSLTSFGAQMSVALAPVTGFVTQGIFAFSRFQDVMTEISARTGLVGDDLERVRQTALQLGADTSFSATQAAQAFLELTASGQSADEALKTLPHVLNLAAAGALELGYAADGLTDIMAQFGLPVQAVSDHVWELADKFGTSREEFEAWDNEVGKITPGMRQLAASMGMTVREMADYINKSEDAAEVTNILSAAAAASSADVTDLIEAFRNGGNAANMFGMSVEETAATFAIFAENGIKGAEAGTQLKSMLTNMARETDDVQQMWRDLGISMYDADGNMRSLTNIIIDLNAAMDGMSDQERIDVIQTLAGSYGQAGLNALLASDGIWAMERSMGNQASAATVAAARTNTFSGRIESLKGSIETLSINFLGPLVDQYLTPLAEKAIELINSINDWVVENEELAGTIALIVAGLAIAGPVIAGIGMYLATFGTLIAVVGGILGFILSPIGLVVLAIAGLGAALMYLTDTSLSELVTMLGDAVHWIAEFTSGLVNAFQSGGLEGAGQFIQDNLITPLLNTIATTDWNAILNDMWARFKTALESAAAIAWDALTWVNTNILIPLKDEIAATDWNQVAKDVGDMIVTAITTMLPIAWDALTWVWSNIVVPLIQSILTADWASVGNALWEAFKVQLTLMATVWEGVNQWVLDHVVTPIWNEIKNADYGQIAKDVAQGIWDGLTTQVSGIIDMNKWILDNIITPVKKALGISSPSTIFFDIGMNVVQGLADGLRSMIGMVSAAAQAVLNAASGPLNSLISLATRALNAVSNAGGGVVSSAIGSPIGGTNQREVEIPPGLQLPAQASGGSVRGGKSYLVGELGPEPFTPNTNGGIMPNDVWEALKNIAASLSGPSLAAAMSRTGGGQGGGDIYQFNVSVPAELLRDDSKLQRNAETFADHLAQVFQKRSL